MKINLHIGAHKTATTYIQSILETNSPALNAAGIGFIPLPILRKTFTRTFMKLTSASFDFRAIEPRFFRHGSPSSVRGVILSDENLIGACGGFVDSGVLYREGPARLRQLRKLLRGHEIHLFFSIRSYETFMPSAYCEVLRNRRTYVSFREFWQKVNVQRSRWPGVFSGLKEALQPESVSVWRYEDFRPNAEAVIRRLAFGAEQPVRAGEAASERASFSAKALEVLEILAERCEPDIVARLMEPIGKSLPKADGFGSFSPFESAERERLQEFYKEDCSNFPVELMTFPSAHERSGSDRDEGRAE